MRASPGRSGMNVSFSRESVLNRRSSDMRDGVYGIENWELRIENDEMLTRSGFASRFSTRAVFGMIHVGPLPGSPLFASLDVVRDGALRDARALRDGGCDGFVVENFG